MMAARTRGADRTLIGGAVAWRLDHRCLIVREVVRRVTAVRADAAREPLSREQLVHAHYGEPRYV
jgi:hypothetical protein